MTKLQSGVNDFATLHPELLNEWDYEKNIGIDPSKLTCGSNVKVWWKCSKCGNSWKAMITRRANVGNSCPVCGHLKDCDEAHSFAAQYPELLKDWDYSKNQRPPSTYRPHSNKKVWWKCHKCGYEFETSINKRTGKEPQQCPRCTARSSSSRIEDIVYYYIHKYFPDAIQTYKPSWIGRSEIDIFIPTKNAAIEYDGRAWHKNIERDLKKDRLLRDHGVTTIIHIREQGLPELKSQSIVIIHDVTPSSLKSIEQPLCELNKLLDSNSWDINVTRDIDQIIAEHQKDMLQKSIVSTDPDKAMWFDKDKNKIKIESITRGSNVKVWWKCPQGHSFKKNPSSFLGKNGGCPICSGKQILIGFNDLKTVRPDLADELVNPDDGYRVTVGSDKTLQWKCPRGHIYETTVSQRVRGYGCNICANKKIIPGINDLASQRPDLLKEWDYEKNTITPEDISPKSGKKVWWRCDRGHSWSQVPYTKGRCPYCDGVLFKSGYNDLRTLYPELTKEFDETKNQASADQIKASHSKTKYWWICPQGHSYQTSLSSRLIGTGCPICAGKQVLPGFNDVKTTNPELLIDWNDSKIAPTEITAGADTKIHWKCHICGYEWYASLGSRTRGNGCPNCRNISTSNRCSKAVVCLDTGKEYKNARCASEDTGINASCIKDCCTGKQKTAGKLHWKYKNS